MATRQPIHHASEHPTAVMLLHGADCTGLAGRGLEPPSNHHGAAADPPKIMAVQDPHKRVSLDAHPRQHQPDRLLMLNTFSPK
jgi:hypothetical protein